MPYRHGFRLCLSRLIYTVRPCLINSCQPCLSESDRTRHSTAWAWAQHGTCELTSAVEWRHVRDLTAFGFFRLPRGFPRRLLETNWNVMEHGDAREGKRRGNWRMEWVTSTLHTMSEHGVSSITTADANSRLPVVDWTEAPADLNGLVRFAERRSLVSARVHTFQLACNSLTFRRLMSTIVDVPHR